MDKSFQIIDLSSQRQLSCSNQKADKKRSAGLSSALETTSLPPPPPPQSGYYVTRSLKSGVDRFNTTPAPRLTAGVGAVE